MENLDRLLRYAEKIAEKRTEKYYKKLINGNEVLLFLISPMSYCNMKCIYCFIEGYETKRDDRNMKLDTIEKIVNMIVDFKNRNPLAVVSIVLHGYEPLQVDTNVLRRIDNIIEESGWHINNGHPVPIDLGVQTNALLLTEEKIKFFYDRKWRVSISLDGPREVHNYNAGIDCYDKIIDNLKTYEKYFKRKPPVISVFTKKHLEIGPEGYYEWLKEEGFKVADLHWPSISPNNPNYHKIMPENPKEVVNYFKELFDIWAEDTEPVDLFPFNGMVDALINGRARGRMCMFRAGCHRIIEFSYDGYIRSCDRGTFTSSYKIEDVEKIEDILFDKEFHKVLHMRPTILKNLHTDCSSCKYFQICLGGCPSEAITQTTWSGHSILGEPRWNKTHNCFIIKELYSHIEKRLLEKGYEIKLS